MSLLKDLNEKFGLSISSELFIMRVIIDNMNIEK